MIPLIILLSLVLLSSALAIISNNIAAKSENYNNFQEEDEDLEEDKEHYEQGLRIMTDASRGIRSPEYPRWREDEEMRKKKTTRVIRPELN